jgi:L-lysine 6-transaminase
MTTTTLSPITPDRVHESLSKWILADGFDVVLDFEKSHGNWLHDARSGRDYLDLLSFFGSNPIGFNHPKMKDPEFLRTLARVAQLKPALSDIYSVEFAQAVDTMGRLAFPSGMKHAFFIEGGALGIENALKTAFDWKVRRNQAKGIAGEKGSQVIHFREAFHGRTGYTLSLTNTDPVKTNYFPKFRWPRIDTPKLRFPVTPAVEQEVAAAEQSALTQIRKAFEDNPDDVAALIIEPIQAEGGDNHFRPQFLKALETVCREHDCLFIVDEVQTGIGLTGKMWCHEHFGIHPDMLAFGKKTQVCGFLAGPRIDEEPKNVFAVPSRINSTFGGNLTDMVRFARYLEVIEEDRLVENARTTGEALLRGLEELQQELSGLIRNARGRGLMIAFDLETPELRDRARQRIMEAGALLLPCGVRSIRFRPSLNLSRAEADAGLDLVRKGLKGL